MYLIQYKRRWVIWWQMLTHPIPSESVSISCRLFASHVTGHVTTGRCHLVLVALKQHNTPPEWTITFLNPDGNEIMDIPSFLFFCTTDWKNIISITSHEFATTTDGEVPPSFNLARFDLNKDCCLKLFTNKECDYFSHSICSFYQLYFNWNNYSIKFVNWLFSMIAKSSFETSPKQPRTTWRHNAAAMS